jgi:ABC-type phosphate/phosphonate transport system substrate-binding protein
MLLGKKGFVAAVCVVIVAAFAGLCSAAELKIALMQAQAGDAKKYQPLLDYLVKKGVQAQFVSAPDYQAAAAMFSQGRVDAMFSGSGIAGTMMIKELAVPLVRPVKADGTSTYSAVVIAPKGAPSFTGTGDYFNDKRVIFTALASAGEFFFRSCGPSKPKEIMKAGSHDAAIDALNRGQADVAIVKNSVWNKEKEKYPGLQKVGEDKGENPDMTLIVSRKMDQKDTAKIADILLGLKNDASADAAAVKSSLQIQGYIKTTEGDFGHTFALLKKSGVTQDFTFKF